MGLLPIPAQIAALPFRNGAEDSDNTGSNRRPFQRESEGRLTQFGLKTQESLCYSGIFAAKAETFVAA